MSGKEESKLASFVTVVCLVIGVLAGFATAVDLGRTWSLFIGEESVQKGYDFLWSLPAGIGVWLLFVIWFVSSIGVAILPAFVANKIFASLGMADDKPLM
jgi:hypothetical protein